MDFVFPETAHDVFASTEIAYPPLDAKFVRAMSEELGDLPVVGKTTFFDLPDHIKRNILEYAGLLRPCLIDFLGEKYRMKYPGSRLYPTCGNNNDRRMSREGWTDKWLAPYHTPCHHPPLTSGVFVASRAAREEIGSLFYSENRFTVTLEKKSDYTLFTASTRWGLQHVRNLNLNLGQMHWRILKFDDGPNYSYHRTVFRVWKDFCQTSTQRMPALQQFSMKCRVKDFETANKLICLMDPFPSLLHCAFHFGEFTDPDTQSMLQRAAWRLTGNLSDTKPPFPFTRLPKEVQLMILEHVIVQRCDPYLSTSDRAPSVVGFLDRKARPTVHSPLGCCGTCSPLGARCFCAMNQNAFSTSCTCFTSPLPYFLVSRQFYQDCRDLFFSKNHFTFLEEDPEPIMRFLASIPTSYSMQIRHLSFKFPMSWGISRPFRNEEVALKSWNVLRRFISEHFHLSRLSLTIVDLGSRGSSSTRSSFMRRMLKEFTALGELGEFRVYLADDPSFEKELEQAVTGKTNFGRFRPYNVPPLGGSQDGPI